MFSISNVYVRGDWVWRLGYECSARRLKAAPRGNFTGARPASAMASLTSALRGVRLHCARLLLLRVTGGAGSLKAPSSPVPWCVPCRQNGVSLMPLKEWTVVVGPFSSLRVELPCDVQVRRQDPLTHPRADRVLVTLRGKAAPDQEDLEVKYDEEAKSLSIVSEHTDSRNRVEVATPARFDIDIKTFGSGNVKVQNVECDSCKIETEKGDSVLQSVKSRHIHISSKGGKVVALETVHGNLDIQASEKSNVYLDKLQGASVKISTEDGCLKTKFLYAETSFLSTATGNIDLGSVHGDVTLQSEQGNITVGSSDGSLKASTHQGAIDVFITQLGKVDLKSHNGNTTIKVPASLKACLQLCATNIDISPEIQLQGVENAFESGLTILSAQMNECSERERRIRAYTETGNISVQIQNWIESLKL